MNTAFTLPLFSITSRTAAAFLTMCWRSAAEQRHWWQNTTACPGAADSSFLSHAISSGGTLALFHGLLQLYGFMDESKQAFITMNVTPPRTKE